MRSTGRRRRRRFGGNDERENTLNQILVEVRRCCAYLPGPVARTAA